MRTRVRACNQEWLIPAEPSVAALLAFRDWCAEQIGDPFDGIKQAIELGLPKEEATAMILEARDTAKQLKKFSLKCPVAREFLNTEIGGFKLTELILRDAYPDMTDQQVQEVTVAYAMQLAARKPEGNDQAPVTPDETAFPGQTATREISVLKTA